jgi:hypothetical protein
VLFSSCFVLSIAQTIARRRGAREDQGSPKDLESDETIVREPGSEESSDNGLHGQDNRRPGRWVALLDEGCTQKAPAHATRYVVPRANQTSHGGKVTGSKKGQKTPKISATESIWAKTSPVVSYLAA